MTKKDFQLIAGVIRNADMASFDGRSAEAHADSKLAFARDMADALASTNPLFKRDLFIQAATGVVPVTARKAKPSIEDPDRDNTTFYDADECPKCGGDRLQGDCDCVKRHPDNDAICGICGELELQPHMHTRDR